ncbi:hypothetical protein ACHWQZ_G014886 [Mnemiopsis leidyi]
MTNEENDIVIIEYGHNGQVTSITNTPRPSRRTTTGGQTSARTQPSTVRTQQSTARTSHPTISMDVRTRNQQILRTLQNIPLIDIPNTTPNPPQSFTTFNISDVTDDDFEAQVRRQEARLNPFSDTPSPTENQTETNLDGNDLLNKEIANITKVLELPNQYNEVFRPLIAISLQEQWFIGNYASYIEDSLTFTKSYFTSIANSIKFGKGPTFWERHSGSSSFMSVNQCVNCLFQDYPEELSGTGISKSWLLVCITTFLQIPDDTITVEHYREVIIDRNLDSYDAFFINIKQLIMLSFIATELIRPAENDIKLELLTMLELIPHSAIILRYLTHSLSANIRCATIRALSTVNFNPEHTFHALFRASVDPDCRVRREFCENVCEFMVELDQGFFEVDDYETEVNVQLTLMGNKVWFAEESKRGILEERLRDLWVHDQYVDVGREAHTALTTLGLIR